MQLNAAAASKSNIAPDSVRDGGIDDPSIVIASATAPNPRPVILGSHQDRRLDMEAIASKIFIVDDDEVEEIGAFYLRCNGNRDFECSHD